MRKVTHYYSLTPEWQYDLAKQLNSKLIDDKLINVPDDLGKGFFYFSPVMDGMSVVYADLTPNTPLKIIRHESENELFIFHYDLSQHVNLIKINNKDYEIGSYEKLDLAIIDNQIASSFKPTVNERTFALRILVEKKLLTDFIARYPSTEYKDTYDGKSNKEAFYHYGNIDSNSVLLLQSIKTKSVHDLSFDPFIKGIALKLLGNFFGKFYDTGHKHNNLTETEIAAISKTRDYLMNNLHASFPSLTFLAAMAGMSESKYKVSFKNNYNITPNNFFIHQKMNLGRKLLKSGNYHSLTEVIYDLNYNKLSYFTAKYIELFKTRPADDLIKKKLA